MTLRHASRIAASAAVLICVLLAATMPVHAHAQLVGSDPADGAVIATAPAKLSLAFNEEVTPLQLQVTLPSGEVLQLTATRAGNTLVADPPANLGTGTHFLSWRVVSSDGHPIGGSLLFSVGRVTATAADIGNVENTSLMRSIWLVRALLYAALFLGVGGVFFRAWIDDGRTPAPRFLRPLLAAGFFAAIAALGLQGLDVLGRGFDALFESVTWLAALRTSYGPTIVLACLSMIAAMASIASPRLLHMRALALAAIAGVGLALAASGHASAASPQWLTRPAVFLHAVTIAIWAGALIPLAILLRRDAVLAAAPLRRFSRAIPFAVAPLVAAGVVLAAVQVGTPRGLMTTDYGLVLGTKLLLVLGLFALAAVNRWRLTACAGELGGARRLARVVAAETLLVVAIFFVAAWWRFTPPPRALALAASTTMVHIHTQKAMAEVTIRPDAPGPVSVSITVMTGDFAALTPKEVTLSLALPSAGIEPISRAATLGPDGLWKIDGLAVPVAGQWSLRVDLLISDFDLVTLEQPIEIGKR